MAALAQQLSPDKVVYVHEKQQAVVVTHIGRNWRKALEVAWVNTVLPGPGELLVDVHCTALNPVDWKQAEYGFEVDRVPFVLGTDFSGTVIGVGTGVADFKLGDAVYGHVPIVHRKIGAFAQTTVVPAELASKKPKFLSFAKASTFALTSRTAAWAIWNHLGWEPESKALAEEQPPQTQSTTQHPTIIPKLDEPLLIWGGATNVGQFAIQLAHLAGRPVFAVADIAHEHRLKLLGATAVIDRHVPSPVVDLRLALQEKGISIRSLRVALDCVGGEAGVLAAAALEGGEPATLLTVLGLPDKAPVPKNVTVQRINIAGVPNALLAPVVCRLSELIDSHKLKPSKAETLPGALAGIPAGLIRLADGQVHGVKLVCEIHDA